MQFDINVTGLDSLAASITLLAEAITYASSNGAAPKAPTRKPKPTVSTAEAGNAPASGPIDTDTPDTATSTAPAAETPPDVPEPSKPAAPSEPATGAAPTIVEVRAAIAALAKTDKTKALGILTKYGAQSVSSLKPEHYAAALAEAQ